MMTRPGVGGLAVYWKATSRIAWITSLPGLSVAFEIAGVALGGLLALLLATARHGNRAANRWLACYAGALALLSLGDYFEDSRLVLAFPHLGHLTDWLIFVVGPSLWMYVRRLTMHARPAFPRWLLHFVPAILCLLVLAPFYLSSAPEKQAVVAIELSGGSTEPQWPLLLAAIHLLAYWGACLLSLRRFRFELRAQFSSLERRTFGWLKWMLAVNLGMWVLWISSLALDRSWALWLDRLAIPGGFYLLAYLGLRQPAVFAGRTAFVPVTRESPTGMAPPTRYARSGLRKERLTELRGRLEALMQTDKPWLENDLTLSGLSDRLGVSTHHLSQLLNEEIGVTFFDFINSRRVEEVKRCLVDPAYRAQTVLEIAFAAGFSSKAAFNSVFKLQTGTTPSKFRQQLPGR